MKMLSANLHWKKLWGGCWTNMFIEDYIEKVANGELTEAQAVDALLETTTSSDIAVVPMPLKCNNKKDPACERDPVKAAQLMQQRKLPKVQ